MISPALLDRVYEAAVATELWPSVLEDIGTSVGGLGAVFIAIGSSEPRWTVSPRLADDMAAYASLGWIEDRSQTEPFFAELYPGFRAETAYRSVAEIEALAVKAEFLIPRGLIAGVASVFQGASDDALHLAVEGFKSHPLAEQAVPSLDLLRPHIGRALSLTAKIRASQTEALVKGLALNGAAAAVIGRDGRMRAANALFEGALGPLMFERRGVLLFTDKCLQVAVTQSIRGSGEDLPPVASIGVRMHEGAVPLVVHLLPLRGRARDVGESDGVLMLVANPANALLPNADLLRLLFDLTPAEARVARLLAEGMTVEQVAATNRTAVMTVRSQLRAIFLKTGTVRQADLVRLLIGMKQPPER